MDIPGIPLLHIHYPTHDWVWRFLSHISSWETLFRCVEFDSSASNDSANRQYGRYSCPGRAGGD